MPGLSDDYFIDAAVSVGAAFFTAVVLRFRLWLRGMAHDDAPLVRQFIAYLLAYLAGFAAIRGLEGGSRYGVLLVAAALAFGVTINGPAPLWSLSYARSVGISLAGILVLLGFYALLTWLGLDLTRDIFSA